MPYSDLKKYYTEHQLDQTQFPSILKHLDVVCTFSPDELDQYIQAWRNDDDFSLEVFLGIARYFKLSKNNSLYIHTLKYLGGLGVIESIFSQMTAEEKTAVHDVLHTELDAPKFGLTPSEMPLSTQHFMNVMESVLPKERLVKVLAGNHHRIPPEVYLKEKAIYEDFEHLDDYLLDLHERKIAELQQHCDTQTVWFEQLITQDVVDFCKKNQEIMSAVRKGDALYITKIPYAPDEYLKATSPKLKSYYACHCPFAREAIQKDLKISENWCYCSGGFGKFPFEIIFNQPLTVRLLNSALDGDAICRFEISLKDVAYKR